MTGGGALVWGGEVVLREDFVVAPGRTLRVRAGARVRAEPRGAVGRPAIHRLCFGDRTLLTSPEAAHLVVLGNLEVEGASGNPVHFDGDSWGGILLVGDARAVVRNAGFRDCGAAVRAVDFSALTLEDCSFEGHRGAVAVGGFAAARARRCRFSGGDRWSLRCDDDAGVRASSCLFEANAVGAEAAGASRLLLRETRFVGNLDCGVFALGSARVSAVGGAWERNRVGLSASGRAVARTALGRFTGNETSVQSTGSSRVLVRGAEAASNGTVVWAQNSSGAVVVGGRWDANGVGVKSSQAASVRVESTRFAGHALAGVYVEEGSRAEVVRAAFVSGENGILARDRARLAAAGCEFSGCRDTAVWSGRKCRVDLEGGRFESNGRDHLCT